MTPDQLAHLIARRRTLMGWSTQHAAQYVDGLSHYAVEHWEAGEDLAGHCRLLEYLEALGIELVSREIPLPKPGLTNQ